MKMTTSTVRDGLFQQSRHVLATADANELVLLDLRSGQYFTLNDVGTRIWALLAPGATHRSIVEVIRAEYDVAISDDGADIERDVEQLLASFLAVGLIRANTARRPEGRAPSPWACAALLVAVRTGLKYGGLDRVRRMLMSRVAGIEHDVHDRQLIDACVRSVALAAAFFPGRALCLERSLTLWYVLRSRGVPVELCLGVQKFPFAAHAWVAYRGTPLNDVPEHVAHFQPLMAVTP